MINAQRPRQEPKEKKEWCPQWMYKYGCEPKLFTDKVEWDKAILNGWVTSPAFVKEIVESADIEKMEWLELKAECKRLNIQTNITDKRYDVVKKLKEYYGRGNSTSSDQ